jgi:beta-galactosidase/beta-glucuronidase
MERKEWLNLNGEWTYCFDFAGVGLVKEYHQSKGFADRINVPFAPESKLSGVAYTDFIPSIWYHRTIQQPTVWAGKNTVLNLGAIYYESEIYIDGKLVSRHVGGSDSYSVDITQHIQDGAVHNLVIQAKSDVRNGLQTAGKQSLQLRSAGCNYTRTTGIWQTVWMEAVDETALQRINIVPDIDNKQLVITPLFYALKAGTKLTVLVKDGEKTLTKQELATSQGMPIVVPIKEVKLWSPESPFLYTIELIVSNANSKVVDEVKSYAGMRKIHIEGNKLYLNNEAYYQRLVLDQGFYPDGIWTAPSDEALKNDILLSKQAGFNGARLHQKVFEERFHYWADKLGYLTWGESASWGLNANSELAARNFISEWSNVVVRDRNHPSIVIWTAMNEQWWPDKVQYPRLVEDVYTITQHLDPTRPINTISGGVHVKTDIWTVHNYQQDGEKLKNELFDGTKYQQTPNHIQAENYGNLGFNSPKDYTQTMFNEYKGGMPYLIDEFGGIKCMSKQEAGGDSWGYGDAAKTEEEFYQRLQSQVDGILSIHQQVWGFCYTQLTDVEQEQNGIYYYNRKPKFDMKRIHAIFTKKLP